MNQRARALGMNGTHFVNPHGYQHADHYTTAADMAALMRAVLGQPDAREILKKRSYTLAATKAHEALVISNAYSILNAQSQYYCAPVIGGKTGYTSSAGQCFVSAAEKGGKTLIAVVLKSGYSAPNKWLDTARLFAYGFAG
jgi:D-alanyl-D-alanine carboxypeptidase